MRCCQRRVRASGNACGSAGHGHILRGVSVAEGIAAHGVREIHRARPRLRPGGADGRASRRAPAIDAPSHPRSLARRRRRHGGEPDFGRRRRCGARTPGSHLRDGQASERRRPRRRSGVPGSRDGAPVRDCRADRRQGRRQLRDRRAAIARPRPGPGHSAGEGLEPGRGDAAEPEPDHQRAEEGPQGAHR